MQKPTQPHGWSRSRPIASSSQRGVLERVLVDHAADDRAHPGELRRVARREPGDVGTVLGVDDVEEVRQGGRVAGVDEPRRRGHAGSGGRRARPCRGRSAARRRRRQGARGGRASCREGCRTSIVSVCHVSRVWSVGRVRRVVPASGFYSDSARRGSGDPSEHDRVGEAAAVLGEVAPDRARRARGVEARGPGCGLRERHGRRRRVAGRPRRSRPPASARSRRAGEAAARASEGCGRTGHRGDRRRRRRTRRASTATQPHRARSRSRARPRSLRG